MCSSAKAISADIPRKSSRARRACGSSSNISRASRRSSTWLECRSPAAVSIRPLASFRASATASARSSCRPRAVCCRTPRRASRTSAAKCWRRCSKMSRIGKKPIALPAGVSAALESGTLTVKGPKGQLAMQVLDDLVTYEVGESEIRVTPVTEAQRNRAAWGMQRTLVQNLVTGVTEGFTKVLEITGVGYRAQAQGKNLRLQLGYSHDVNFPVPEGIDVKTPDQNTVEISGIDRQQVGQVAAEIRRWRKPEPYKGKGIKYRGEYIFRKEGKKK